MRLSELPSCAFKSGVSIGSQGRAIISHIMWFLTASCLHSAKPSRWQSCTRTRKCSLLPRTLKNLMHVFGCVSVSLLYCWPSVLCSSINSREHHYLLGLGMTRIQLFFLQSKCFKKSSVFVVYRGMSLHLWCMHLSFCCALVHKPWFLWLYTSASVCGFVAPLRQFGS